MIITIVLLVFAVAFCIYLLLRLQMAKRNVLHLDKEKNELNGFFLKFSNSLSTQDGLKNAINSICQHVADLVGAEAVALYENINGELVAKGVYGPYFLIPSKNQKIFEKRHFLHEAVKLCRFRCGDGSFVGDIAATGNTEILTDGSVDSRFSNIFDPGKIGGVIGQALLVDGKISGVLVILNNRKNFVQPFSQLQITQVSHMPAQIILMYQVVNAYLDMNSRERIGQELELARQIQLSLLPAKFPKWEQFSINAFTRPAKEVNGDFYDFVKIDDDRMLIVIGDACGKGVPACMLSAMTRSFIRALADKFTTLNQFLIELNDKIHSDTDDGRFITLNCCLLDKKRSLFEFGRAGHTELITFVHNHLRVMLPDGAALGILPSEYTTFDTFLLAFEYGMSFLIFSDGITEAINEQEEEFGLERLMALFQDSLQSGYDANTTIKRILDEVKQFSPDQADDQTLILIQYL